MRHPGSRRMFEYWSDLRGGRAAPYKSEVTAQGVGRALAGNTFVLERLPEGQRRFRLAGSRLYDLFGLELRGMSAGAIMEGASRARFAEVIDACLAAPCIGVIGAEARTPEGAATRIEIVIAPLRSDFDQMNRILGAAHAFGAGEVDGAPRRCRITRAATLDYNAAARRDLGGPLPGFAEVAAPALDRPGAPPALRAIDGGAPAPRSGRRRGHLRVVKD